MAKRGTVRIEGEIEGDPSEELAREQAELDELNAEEDGDLFRVTDELRALGAGVQLLITRTYPNTPDMAGYVGEMTLGEYSAEEMYNRYGAGRYKVRLRGPRGLIKGGGSVHIAKRAAPPSGGAGASGDVASVLRLLQEKEDARRKEDSERRGRLLELTIPAAITGMTTVLAAMMNGNRAPDLTGLITALKPAPGPSIAELTTAVANIKTIAGGDKSDSQLEVLLKVLDVAKEHFGSDGKGDSNWLDIVRDLIKEGPAMVQPLLEQMKARQDAATVVPSRPMIVAPMNAPQPVTESLQRSPNESTSGIPLPENTSAPAGENDVNLFSGLIRTQTEKLLTWAIEQKRVELYAEVLLEELPAIVHQYVTPAKALDYLAHPHWFETVTQYEPRLAVHRPWLDRMRRELIAIIREQEGTSETPEQIVDTGETPE
jgi:hypothetical protein